MITRAIKHKIGFVILGIGLLGGTATLVRAVEDGVVRMESEILEVVTLKGPEHVFGSHVNVPRTARLVSRKTADSAGFETLLRVTDAYEAPEPRRYGQARIKEGDLTLSRVRTIINEIPGVSDFEETVDFRLPLDKVPQGADLTIELISDTGDNRTFTLPARYLDMQRRAISRENGR